MNTTQLYNLIVATLRELDLYSIDAARLVQGTIAQESQGGEYIRQIGTGPALGIAQMEPATFNDITDNYLRYNPALKLRVQQVCNLAAWNAAALEYNIKFAIAMCRVHYLRVKAPLPANTNPDAVAAYWKKYYNTVLGKGTVEEFKSKYTKLI